MCVSPAADFELGADKGGQSIHVRASSEYWAVHEAVVQLDPALKWCMRNLKIVETEQPLVSST